MTGQGIGGQTVTLTLNGTQSCTATTNGYGKASCSVTPNESAGTYPVTGTFAGNTSTSPQLLPSNGHNNFVVTPAPTTVTYTGATTATNGSSVTLSSTLTSNGTPLSGQPRDPDARHGEDGAELHRHDELVGCRIVLHPVREPGRRLGDRHRELRRERLLPVVQHLEHRQGLQLRRRAAAVAAVAAAAASGGGYGGGYTEPPPVGGGRGCG